MQFTISVLLALATVAFAVPQPDRLAITARAVTTTKAAGGVTSSVVSAATCVTSTYDPQITHTAHWPFSNATCKLDKALTPGQPLSCTFPTANKLGTILGPNLRLLIGDQAVGDIDVVAEDLCVSARTNKKDGNGLCDEALQAVYDIAVHQNGGQQAANKYRCLLDLLCVARADNANPALCQYLLAGVDCVANRLIQDAPVECTK